MTEGQIARNNKIALFDERNPSGKSALDDVQCDQGSQTPKLPVESQSLHSDLLDVR